MSREFPPYCVNVCPYGPQQQRKIDSNGGAIAGSRFCPAMASAQTRNIGAEVTRRFAQENPLAALLTSMEPEGGEADQFADAVDTAAFEYLDQAITCADNLSTNGPESTDLEAVLTVGFEEIGDRIQAALPEN